MNNAQLERHRASAVRKLIVLEVLLFCGVLTLLAQSTPPVNVDVDLGTRTSGFVPVYSWFGYDEANYTAMPAGRLLLDKLEALSPVPVVFLIIWVLVHFWLKRRVPV